MRHILVTISGGGVTMAEVNGTQANGLPFADENKKRLSLRDIVYRYWGGDNVLVVFDAGNRQLSRLFGIQVGSIGQRS